MVITWLNRIPRSAAAPVKTQASAPLWETSATVPGSGGSMSGPL